MAPRDLLHAPEADVRTPGIGFSPRAVSRSQAAWWLVPGAAAVLAVTFEDVEYPFPNVPGHVEGPARRRTGRVLPYGSSPVGTVVRSIFLPDVTPWINTAVRPPRCLLPFRLGREALSRPAAISLGLRPIHTIDRMGILLCIAPVAVVPGVRVCASARADAFTILAGRHLRPVDGECRDLHRPPRRLI